MPEKFAVSSFVRKMMPKVYFIGKNNTIFNAKNVLFWISEAVIEALVVTMLVI